MSNLVRLYGYASVIQFAPKRTCDGANCHRDAFSEESFFCEECQKFEDAKMAFQPSSPDDNGPSAA